jgi:transcriptional regulator with XRE-family HTH domain
MGRGPAYRPTHLHDKLRLIREFLDIDEKEMAEQLQSEETPVSPGHVSEYEDGKRLPQYNVLLRYARLGKVSTDELIDDSLNLPNTHYPALYSLFDEGPKPKKKTKPRKKAPK